jgi:hypothetical protein
MRHGGGIDHALREMDGAGVRLIAQLTGKERLGRGA